MSQHWHEFQTKNLVASPQCLSNTFIVALSALGGTVHALSASVYGVLKESGEVPVFDLNASR